MIITINPSKINGIIQAPASKSSMQRACAAALVKRGISHIHNAGKSNDDIAALSILQSCGVQMVNHTDGSITIDSSNFLNTHHQFTVHCGESGLGIRMFTPILCLYTHWVSIEGKGSLLKRPMHFFDEVLPQLGVQIKSQKGYLPIAVKGPLQANDISIDGSQSSQYLTGLLFSFAAIKATNTSIKVNNLTSKPYIDLTLEVMKQFGLSVPFNQQYEAFIFSKQASTNKPISYTVEGDWSGAAFLLVAGAVAGKVSVKGLSMDSTQADKKIMEALTNCGALIQYHGHDILVQENGNHLNAFHFDATDCPDLFPPLAVLAACCEGTSRISGVHRLTHKESNRALTLQDELGKMNIVIQFEGDVMLIIGTKNIKGAVLSSRHDHRIAMACAVAALCADSAVTIEDADAINKSYPGFFKDIKSLAD